LVSDARVVVVTNQEQAALVRKQLPRVKHIIARTDGTQYRAGHRRGDGVYASRTLCVMAVLPADSYIPDRKLIGKWSVMR